MENGFTFDERLNMEIVCPKCNGYVTIDIDWGQATFSGVVDGDRQELILKGECENERFALVDDKEGETCGNAVTVTGYFELKKTEIEWDEYHEDESD